MARKLRRRKITLGRVFVLLLVPWIVLGAIAAALYKIGLPDYVAILAGLAGSLVVTFLIRNHESRVRGTRIPGPGGGQRPRP